MKISGSLQTDSTPGARRGSAKLKNSKLITVECDGCIPKIVRWARFLDLHRDRDRRLRPRHGPVQGVAFDGLASGFADQAH